LSTFLDALGAYQQLFSGYHVLIRYDLLNWQEHSAFSAEHSFAMLVYTFELNSNIMFLKVYDSKCLLIQTSEVHMCLILLQSQKLMLLLKEK
jgi:hypothetical protein